MKETTSVRLQEFWNDFEDGRIVINCKIEKQAKVLFEMFKERGYSFGLTKIKDNTHTNWRVYEKETCYCFESGTILYGDIKCFEEDDNNYEIVGFEELILLNEPPTLDELKTGMILVSKNGSISMVLRDTINGDIISGEIWKPLEYVTMYGTREDGGGFDYDIIEVWQPTDNRFFLGDSNCIGETSLNTDNCILIWEYKEQPKRKKMTLEEVEEELGYKIEIIE